MQMKAPRTSQGQRVNESGQVAAQCGRDEERHACHRFASGWLSRSRKDPPTYLLHTIPTSNENTTMPHPFCTNFAPPRMSHGCICNQSAPLRCKHSDSRNRARCSISSRSQDPTSSWVQKGSTGNIDVSTPFTSQKGAIPMVYMHAGRLLPRMTTARNHTTRPQPRRPQASRNILVVICSRTCVSDPVRRSFEIFERSQCSQHWDGITRHCCEQDTR
jgi:hypothetical protein